MKENEKMIGKDYITCGVFSLLYMVAMLLSAVMNISGYTAIFYPTLVGIFVGILFVILEVKVPKKGAVVIFSIIPALYFFASGLLEGFIGFAGVMLFALIAEWMMSRRHDNLNQISVAAVVYTLYMSTLGMAENFVFTDTYCDNALAHGINETIVEQMRSFYHIKPLWAVVIVSTAITTWLGTLLGKKIMSKHLKKAGIL